MVAWFSYLSLDKHFCLIGPISWTVGKVCLIYDPRTLLKDMYVHVFKIELRIDHLGFSLFALFKLWKCVSVNTVICGSFVLSGSTLFLACFSLHFHLLWLLWNTSVRFLMYSMLEQVLLHLLSSICVFEYTQVWEQSTFACWLAFNFFTGLKRKFTSVDQ